MNAEDLLKKLGEAEREEESLRKRSPWERLAQDSLTTTERKDLEAQAQADDEKKDLYELYRPFDEKEQDALFGSVMASLETAGTVPASRANIRPVEPSNVIPFRARMKRTIAVAIGPLAAAAALALWMAQPAGYGAIPNYDMAITSADLGTRGEETHAEKNTVAIQSGSQFELVLRPTVPTKGKVDARVFLVRDGNAKPVNAPLEISNEGAVHVAGAVPDLFGNVKGAWDLVVVVGDTRALPTTSADVARALAPGGATPGYRLLVRKIVFP